MIRGSVSLLCATFLASGLVRGASVFWAFQSDSSTTTNQTGPNYNDLGSTPTIALFGGTDGASTSNPGTGGANGYSYNGVTYGGSGGSNADGRSLQWAVSSGSGNSLIGCGFTVSGLNFTGAENFTMSFDIRSATGSAGQTAPTTFTSIEYSLDGGGNWVNATSLLAVPTWPGGTATGTTGFVSRSINLSSLDAIENQANVSFRFTFSSGTTDPTTNQNIRFDNLLFTNVPEPASISLCALGGMLLLARRRK